jgi:hypothetical protein
VFLQNVLEIEEWLRAFLCAPKSLHKLCMERDVLSFRKDYKALVRVSFAPQGAMFAVSEIHPHSAHGIGCCVQAAFKEHIDVLRPGDQRKEA